MQLISKAVEWFAEHCADRVALAFPHKELTYKELNTNSNLWAGYLDNQGVSSSDRVLLLMDNQAEFVEVAIGLVRLGATVVFMNTGLSPSEISRICKESLIRFVITEQKYTSLESYILKTESLCPFFIYKETVVNNLKQLKTKHFLMQHETVNESIEQPSFIFFTSGSTGKPKGIVIDQAKFALDLTSYSVAPPVSYFIARPLFFRAHFSSLCFMLQEGKTILLISTFEPEPVFSLIINHNAYQIISSPFDLLALAQWMKMKEHNLPVSMKEWISTGSALYPRIRSELQLLVPEVRLIDMYGLSEIGVVSLMNQQHRDYKEGAVGRPSFFVKIRIVGQHSEELPAGQSGEICVSSRFMMNRYLNDDELNKQSFLGEYFRTGDLGYIDPEGYLYIEGRKDQSINRAGYIFHLSEIENVLRSCSYVEQVAVIRSINEYGLQVPVAYIQQAQENRLSEAMLIEHLGQLCREKLSSFKIPAQFVVVEHIPLNEAGKINTSLLQRVI